MLILLFGTSHDGCWPYGNSDSDTDSDSDQSLFRLVM